jgi:hypothetical protein
MNVRAVPARTLARASAPCHKTAPNGANSGTPRNCQHFCGFLESVFCIFAGGGSLPVDLCPRKRHKTTQSGTKRHKTAQNGTKRHKTAQNGTRRHKTAQNTAQDGIKRHKTAPTAPTGTTRHKTAQDGGAPSCRCQAGKRQAAGLSHGGTVVTVSP